MRFLAFFAFAAFCVCFGQDLPPGPRLYHDPKIQNTAEVQTKDLFWKLALREVTADPSALNRCAVVDKKRGSFRVLLHGSTAKKEIAVTIDDGPHPICTYRLIQLLKLENVPATFFVIGFMAERQPALVRAEAAAGFGVGNHTFSHVFLPHLKPAQVQTEYRANSDLIARLTGRRPAYCRPPGGDYTKDVVRSAELNGMTTVLWTDDPGDYTKDPVDKILKKAVHDLSPGGILLFHDGAPKALQVLPRLIAYARKQGYRFVSLSELEKSATQLPRPGLPVRPAERISQSLRP